MHTESVPGTVSDQEKKCHKLCRNHWKCGALFLKVKYSKLAQATGQLCWGFLTVLDRQLASDTK